MKRIMFLAVLGGVLSLSTSAMAGNFRAGKIPELGNDSGSRAFSKAQASQASEAINNQRNGDPCGLLSKWGLILDEWKDGNAEHGLSPAEIIVLATEENDGNVVTLLVKAEIAQKLVTVGQKWNNDFEYRLLEPMGYGANQADRYRWYGFVPNVI